MRNRLLSLTLTSLALLGPGHGTVQADLRFAQPVVELGRVRTGVPLTHRFAFVAAAAPGVEITDVKSSCGCVLPQLTKRVYRDGEAGTLSVELNTLSVAPGPHLWRVQVFYRVERTDYEMVLQLKADVVREVLVEPSALVLTVERPLQREIFVKDIRPRPFAITSVQASSANLQPRVEAPTRDAEGRWQCKIVLDVTPDATAGRRQEVVAIHTDDPDYRELRIPVTLIRKSVQPLTATPAELTLTVLPGQPVPSQRVLIRDREQRAVTIEKVEPGDAALQVSFAPGEQRVGTVKVNLERAHFKGGEVRTLLHIHVSQPVRQILAIPVTVRGS